MSRRRPPCRRCCGPSCRPRWTRSSAASWRSGPVTATPAAASSSRPPASLSATGPARPARRNTPPRPFTARDPDTPARRSTRARPRRPNTRPRRPDIRLPSPGTHRRSPGTRPRSLITRPPRLGRRGQVRRRAHFPGTVSPAGPTTPGRTPKRRARRTARARWRRTGGRTTRARRPVARPPPARRDTVASHRRQDSGAPPPGGPPPAGPGGTPPPAAGPPRERSRRKLVPWLPVLVAVGLLGAGVGTRALVSGGSGSHASGMGAMASMSAKAKAKPKPSALMSALATTNKSADAAGKLPPSTCTQQGTAMATCTAPYTGITAVVFQTYPSLTALYNAYEAKVKSVSGSSAFQQNFSDCGLEQTNGEVGWNHNFQHPKTYTVEDMAKGMVKDEQAAGRVYCNFTGGQE